MTIICDEIDGVAHWASYFINGDDSGLDECDKRLADIWLSSIAPYYPVSTVEGSERFTWSGTLYGADCSGVTVCTYICYSGESV